MEMLLMREKVTANNLTPGRQRIALWKAAVLEARLWSLSLAGRQFLKDCRLFPAWKQSCSLVSEQTLSTNYCVCSKLSLSSLKDCCKAFIFGLTQNSSSIKKQQLVLESITMWTKKNPVATWGIRFWFRQAIDHLNLGRKAGEKIP